MSRVNRLRTIIILFCLIHNPFACGNSIIIFRSRMLGDITTPFNRNEFYAHLLTTIPSIFRRIFYSITIRSGQSHTINIKIILRSSSASRITAIREGSHIAILLNERLIIGFLIGNRTHNRHTIISETYDFSIDRFTLMQLTFDCFMEMLTEFIRTIEAAIIAGQQSAASAINIIILIDRLTIFMGNFIPQSTLIALKNRQIADSCRSAMKLTSNFNKVAGLECIKVISKLCSINMLFKQRSNRVLMLASLAYIRAVGLILLISTRNILIADRMTINFIDDVAYLQISTCIIVIAIIKTLNRQIQTIRTFATQSNSSNITLIYFHITSVSSPIRKLAAQMIGDAKFEGKLEVAREVDTNIANLRINGNASVIAEESCDVELVGIGMCTQLFNFYNITTVINIHCTLPFLILISFLLEQRNGCFRFSSYLLRDQSKGHGSILYRLGRFVQSRKSYRRQRFSFS